MPPAVTMEAIALPQMPEGVLEPLSVHSTLVAAVGEGAALLPVPERLSSVRLGGGEPVQTLRTSAIAGRFGSPFQVGPYVGVLSPEVSIQLDIADPASGEVLRVVLRPVDAAGSTMQLAVSRRGSDDPSAGAAAFSETSLAQLPFEDGGIALVAPLAKSGAALLIIDRREVTPEQLAEARSLAEKQIAASMQQRPAISPQRLMWESARQAMQDQASRRSALVSLATQLQAPICQDLALSADEMTLSEFSSALAEPEWGKSSPGWELDKAAFDFMGKLLIDGRLPRELAAVLATHAGEAGHSTLSMQQLIGAATSRRDLENRLVAENYIQLEEVSPAARVRAYDWLRSKGKAPANYDPLASASARRTALNAAIEAMTASTTTTEK